MFYQFDNNLYERDSGRLLRVLGKNLEEAHTLSLTHQAYLNFLIDKTPHIATFDELAQLEGKHVNNNTVSKHISKLKKIVGCDIENVPRQGYKLMALPPLVDIKQYGAAPSPATNVESKPDNNSPILLVSLLLLVCTVMGWWVYSGTTKLQVELKQKATMMQGAEKHGVLSPDGRFLAFEYKKRPEQQHSLWIKNLESGENVQLTTHLGVDDEISAFSKDGSRLLFHRTHQHNRCSVNEIHFSSFDPIEFDEKELFGCEQGFKSINAEYGKDHNTVFFTDDIKGRPGHHVLRFERLNREITEVFSLPNSGQGFYRVYPLAGANELLLLSSDDYSSTKIYQLSLLDNKLQHLVDVPAMLKTIAVDRTNRVFYYLGQNTQKEHGGLYKFALDSQKITHRPLAKAHDSFMSVSQNGKMLSIDGGAINPKKIVQIKNPLKTATFEIVDEIVSSGSDSMPVVCADALYFFSNRTGRYQLWRRFLKQNKTEPVFDFDYRILPKDYSLSPDCSKVAVVENNSHIKLVDLIKGQTLYDWDELVFINAKWLGEDQLVASVENAGFRLTQIDLNTFEVQMFDTLPQSKTFLLAKNNQQLWLLGHQDNQLSVFDMGSKQIRATKHHLPLFRNRAWVNWQDKGIYYCLSNGIAPMLSYLSLTGEESKQFELPNSFINAHITLASDNDELLWIDQNKTPQRDIYLFNIN